jgi:hypothetical protein
MVLWNISRPFADLFSTWMARAPGRFFSGIANQKSPNKTGIDTCIIIMMMIMMMMMMMLIIMIISIIMTMMIIVLTIIITIGSTTQHKNRIFDAQQWDNWISTVSCFSPSIHGDFAHRTNDCSGERLNSDGLVASLKAWEIHRGIN